MHQHIANVLFAQDRGVFVAAHIDYNYMFFMLDSYNMLFIKIARMSKLLFSL